MLTPTLSKSTFPKQKNHVSQQQKAIALPWKKIENLFSAKKYHEAVPLLITLANKKNDPNAPEAQYRLGLFYLKETAYKNERVAIQSLIFAAESQYQPAIAYLKMNFAGHYPQQAIECQPNQENRPSRAVVRKRVNASQPRLTVMPASRKTSSQGISKHNKSVVNAFVTPDCDRESSDSFEMIDLSDNSEPEVGSSKKSFLDGLKYHHSVRNTTKDYSHYEMVNLTYAFEGDDTSSSSFTDDDDNSTIELHHRPQPVTRRSSAVMDHFHYPITRTQPLHSAGSAHQKSTSNLIVLLADNVTECLGQPIHFHQDSSEAGQSSDSKARDHERNLSQLIEKTRNFTFNPKAAIAAAYELYSIATASQFDPNRLWVIEFLGQVMDRDAKISSELVQEAEAYLIQFSAQGDPMAAFQLTMHYIDLLCTRFQSRLTIDRYEQCAMQELKKAIEAGHPTALAFLFSLIDKKEQIYSAPKLRFSSRNLISLAHSLIGELYETGANGRIKIESEKALHFYMKALTMNPENSAARKKIMNAALMKDNPDALFFLFLNKNIAKISSKAAFGYLIKASRFGHSSASVQLSGMYADGDDEFSILPCAKIAATYLRMAKIQARGKNHSMIKSEINSYPILLN